MDTYYKRLIMKIINYFVELAENGSLEGVLYTSLLSALITIAIILS